MIRHNYTIIGIAVLLLSSGIASGFERFPPPDFESGYVQPSPTTPNPRQDTYEYIDTVVLLTALSLASYLVLKTRRRRFIFVLSLLSLFYFGFWRKGCVCPIGAIQNVALSIFDKDYAIPIAVMLFFLLPLLFTLFFGRTFCAAVCPLGAIQDVVHLSHTPVPEWLENGLRLFAYLYLAAAVLFAATGSAFIICRYDPFVSIFRMSGNLNMLILGGCFLFVGLFIGRPYCRFACPYGVILRQLSRISKWRVTITPDDCIKCRLCEDSCPFGAIREPTAEAPTHDYIKSRKWLAFLILLLPLLVLALGWIGFTLRPVTSRMHATVRLADRIYLEDTGQVKDTTDASSAFRATGRQTKQLYDEALDIQAGFGRGGWFFGGFVGLVIALKLIGLSLRRQRIDYEAERAGCLACGRCFEYCPKEHVKRKLTKETIVKADENSD
ncbi:MAG: 4Fe-4S binding protein [Phycisphaerae bacterium]|nr:4Fe-4S binding protein [Phycisphaerae bacterium]NIP50770.1 4Fe-4S binding protein [Phycisphaerae bacterium]NIS49934.1 4Fe-4S binding protein [Phycisphaerae bacterium]NIU07638.1 4Fe-4S binding protein [Phycisphaerae bacterium]NIU57420.1 4Fe-4S binding protein [Phycisphaerae bacterium]